MAIYPEDKMKLSKLCLKSFKRSLGSLKAKMLVLLDNCPNEYEALFLNYFDEEDLEFIRLDGLGNRATFGLQIESLLNQSYADTLYFAEDDYFFLPNQFVEMINFLQSHKDVHFISPYDHPDYYCRDIHKQKYEIRAYGTHHWRTAASTTLSFLTTKHTLAKTKNAFERYSRSLASDYLWVSITKYNVFNPIRTIKYLFFNRIYFLMLARAWLYCWRQMLFGRRWKLWVPMPTIATHMEEKFLAPCINWKEVFSKQVVHDLRSE
jgi:hypothetical protein